MKETEQERLERLLEEEARRIADRAIRLHELQAKLDHVQRDLKMAIMTHADIENRLARIQEERRLRGEFA